MGSSDERLVHDTTSSIKPGTQVGDWGPGWGTGDPGVGLGNRVGRLGVTRVGDSGGGTEDPGGGSGDPVGGLGMWV